MSDVADVVRDLERTETVQTSNGPIRGYREDGLHVFKGVRYAAPPLGALRFQPPQRPKPWTEVADTVGLGAPRTACSSTSGPPPSPARGR